MLTLVLTQFDYGFAENGLTAYRLGEELPSESFISFLGEEKYQKLAKFCLAYISKLEIPKMRCVWRTRSTDSQRDVRRIPPRHGEREPDRPQCIVRTTGAAGTDAAAYLSATSLRHTTRSTTFARRLSKRSRRSSPIAA